MKKSFLLFIIVLLALPALADDRTLTAGEYWVDNNHLSRTTVSIGSDGLMQFALDGTQLSEGLHTLHYRAQDSEGCYSAVQSWLFYRGRLGQEHGRARGPSPLFHDALRIGHHGRVRILSRHHRLRTTSLTLKNSM